MVRYGDLNTGICHGRSELECGRRTRGAEIDEKAAVCNGYDSVEWKMWRFNSKRVRMRLLANRS